MKAGLILNVLFFSSGFLYANAWDIAVAVGDQVEFLNATGGVVGELSEGMSEVRALAYNADLRTLYFSDEERSDGSIFQLTVPKNMSAKLQNVTVSTVVSKQVHSVKGVAYDDRTGILYWSNGPGHSILWIQIGSTDEPQAGQPLLKVEDQIPMGIAIDNCKRYLYWTNCGKTASIERSLLDGSNRQTLTSEDLALPYAVVVDQTTDRIYWVDERPGAEFRIESADLHGKDRRVLFSGSDHQPFALAVSAGQVFWADHIHTSVWRLPLDSPHSTSTKLPVRAAAYHSSPKALVSAYSGVWTRERCNPVVQPVIKIIPATVTKTTTDPNPVVLRENTSHPICLNKGLWIRDEGYCNCLPGYSGALCEVDECLDYCVQGVCHITNEERECVCTDGYSGPRCEVPVCHNYCVTGTCSVDLRGQPQCHCKEGYSGDRCEVNFTQQQETDDSLQEVCLAFCKLWTQSSKENIQPFDVCSCPEMELISAQMTWDWYRDHVLLGLLAVCIGLSVLVVVLAKKVLVLRRRPRVKKRIIVNKSVTPLTSRPSEPQCEITIENCCNMNICETPCFEPDFRQPQTPHGKPSQNSKEEKKTLLGNMELPPDDLY
ncbi:protein cueball isoform X1 [Homalodisca vitripennis]|nr:protein cueball isoform X1 [Homalodisca vitripennis]